MLKLACSECDTVLLSVSETLFLDISVEKVFKNGVILSAKTNRPEGSGFPGGSFFWGDKFSFLFGEMRIIIGVEKRPGEGEVYLLFDAPHEVRINRLRSGYLGEKGRTYRSNKKKPQIKRGFTRKKANKFMPTKNPLLPKDEDST